MLGTSALARPTYAQRSAPNIQGIIWQPDNATVQPRGLWDRLGARQLLVQWTVVDGLAFVPGTDFKPVPKLPDWQHIARQPWAQEVILGLAGRYDERGARREFAELARISGRLARLPTPLTVIGWYFPVEVDPTWTDAPRLVDSPQGLPRPLYLRGVNITLPDGARRTVE